MSLEKYKKESLQDKIVNLVKKVEKVEKVEKPKKVKIKVEGNNKPQKKKK